MNKYELLGVVGEGAYGIVLKCRNKDTGETVAIKKFKEAEDDEENVRKTMVREVKILRMLRHPNIVNLKEAFRRKSKLYLVFEFVSKNLLEVLEANPSGVGEDAMQRYMLQLCLAIDCCHSQNVMHRDIKPENLLINVREQQLKLCDFGFARTYTGNTNLSDYVATRWYRAPELLLGSTGYEKSVDMFAMGCIMGELADGEPLFPGESEIDQLYIIQRMLGPLTSQQNELFLRNPQFVGLKFPDMSRPETLQKKYAGKLSKQALSFIKTLLHMEPADRATSRECIDHPYFDDMRHEYVSLSSRVVSDPRTSRSASSASERNADAVDTTQQAGDTQIPMISRCRQGDAKQERPLQNWENLMCGQTKPLLTKNTINQHYPGGEPGATGKPREDEVPLISTFGRAYAVASRESHSKGHVNLGFEMEGQRVSPTTSSTLLDERATPTPPSLLPPDRLGRFSKPSRNVLPSNSLEICPPHAAEAKEDSYAHAGEAVGMPEDKGMVHFAGKNLGPAEVRRPHKQKRRGEKSSRNERSSLDRNNQVTANTNDDTLSTRTSHSNGITRLQLNQIGTRDRTSESKTSRPRSSRHEEDVGVGPPPSTKPKSKAGRDRNLNSMLTTLQPVHGATGYSAIGTSGHDECHIGDDAEQKPLFHFGKPDFKPDFKIEKPMAVESAPVALSLPRNGKGMQPPGSHGVGKRKKMRRESVQPPPFILEHKADCKDASMNETIREHEREFQREREQRRENEIRELREFSSKLPVKLQDKLGDGVFAGESRNHFGAHGFGGVDTFGRIERRLPQPVRLGNFQERDISEGMRSDRITLEQSHHMESEFPTFR